MKESSHRISVEEIVNSTTHGVGLVLSVAGFVVLLAMAIRHGTAWHVVGCAIYGSTLICLYLASTLYHGIRSPRLKRVLLILDHCAIYLLIAGTYTRFLLVNLRGGWGRSLLGIVWGCAMAGIIFKIWFVDHFKILSTVFYLAMGWLALAAARPFVIHVSPVGLRWLLAGGVMYTVGVVFYACRKIPYGHAVWHVFVMAGSVCHYVAVLYAVVLVSEDLNSGGNAQSERVLLPSFVTVRTLGGGLLRLLSRNCRGKNLCCHNTLPCAGLLRTATKRLSPGLFDGNLHSV